MPRTAIKLRWKPAFWTRAQAGWDWIPARWVRRPAGWEFRAGHWVREPDAVDVNVTVGGRPTARVVTPRPGTVLRASDRPGRPRSTSLLRPRAPRTNATRSPRPRPSGRVRVVVPGTGMPYYVIRPPGSYPYGPGGVVVPGRRPAVRQAHS